MFVHGLSLFLCNISHNVIFLRNKPKSLSEWWRVGPSSLAFQPEGCRRVVAAHVAPGYHRLIKE